MDRPITLCDIHSSWQVPLREISQPTQDWPSLGIPMRCTNGPKCWGCSNSMLCRRLRICNMPTCIDAISKTETALYPAMTPPGALATLGHISELTSGMMVWIFEGDTWKLSLHTPKSWTQLANHYLLRRLPTYSRCTNAWTTKRTHCHAYNREWLTKPFLNGPS